MRLFQLFEDTHYKTLVIFPGRFQPVTRNHFNVYNHLCKEFSNADVFIATSGKVELPKSPFTFAEKKALLSFIGIDPSHIVETKSPYAAKEITEHYDPTHTVLIFAVGQKDMEEDPRFNFKPKKDGSPSYFQPYNPSKKLESFDKHAYIIAIPNFKFEINGQQVMGATQIRAMFAEASVDEQKKLFTELYGKFNPKLFSIVSSKLSNKVEEKLSPEFMRGVKKVGATAAAAATFGLAGMSGMHNATDPSFYNKELAKYSQVQRRRNDKNQPSSVDRQARKRPGKLDN
jgi:hypothetical protein